MIYIAEYRARFMARVIAILTDVGFNYPAPEAAAAASELWEEASDELLDSYGDNPESAADDAVATSDLT